MKKILSLILGGAFALGTAFGLSACGGGEKDPYADIDKSLLYGMDEPLYEKGASSTSLTQVRGFDLDTTVDFVAMLGAKSFRFRMPNGFIQSPGQYDEEIYEYLQSASEKFRNAGVTNLIGQASLFPAYSGFRPDSANSAPRPDDEHYGDWLQAVTEMWQKVAELFPEITQWEMGNEFNTNTFFHPNGYQGIAGSLEEGVGGFSREEQVIVVTDYMYYAAKGIKAANPKNIAIMPGLSPTQLNMKNVEYFVEDIYNRIKSGEAPYGNTKSKDPDDYFGALCWHPYAKSIDESWLQSQKDVYNIVIENGDEGKKVIFSELGFSDNGVDDVEELQIGYTERVFEYCENELPFVESVLSFRLYECEYAATWGGSQESHFGFFREPTGDKGFSPKAKAYKLQQIYGGSGDLAKYETPAKS